MSDPDAQLQDAVMSAAARDRTADETGRRRDNLRAVLAIWRVAWRRLRARRRAATLPRARPRLLSPRSCFAILFELFCLTCEAYVRTSESS